MVFSNCEGFFFGACDAIWFCFPPDALFPPQNYRSSSPPKLTSTTSTPSASSSFYTITTSHSYPQYGCRWWWEMLKTWWRNVEGKERQFLTFMKSWFLSFYGPSSPDKKPQQKFFKQTIRQIFSNRALKLTRFFWIFLDRSNGLCYLFHNFFFTFFLPNSLVQQGFFATNSCSNIHKIKVISDSTKNSQDYQWRQKIKKLTTTNYFPLNPFG